MIKGKLMNTRGNIYIYIYISTELKSVIQKATMAQPYSLIILSVILWRTAVWVVWYEPVVGATLTSSRIWVVKECWNVRALASVPSSTKELFTDGMNSSSNLRFLMPETFFMSGVRDLGKQTYHRIITLFIFCFSRQKLDQGPCYSIDNWNWLRRFEWCSVLT